MVGRRREVEVLLAALAAGRHVLLEGPPGTGKSTLLRSLASGTGLGFAFVEGNAELTPARLTGSYDPARVLADGYHPDAFLDGPLTEALREGSLLYVEEINRVPEETLNVLITVMSEGELHIPRLGRVAAAPGFRLVAAMNPFDAVGTARISSAVYDRCCRLRMDYQAAGEEAEIVARQAAGVPPQWAAQVVELVRRTRDHPDIRVGSSVRGAVDTVLVARSLAALRGLALSDHAVGLDAAQAALSGRIRLHEGSPRTAEEIVEQLYTEVFGAPPPPTDPGEQDGRAGPPTDPGEPPGEAMPPAAPDRHRRHPMLARTFDRMPAGG